MRSCWRVTSDTFVNTVARPAPSGEVDVAEAAALPKARVALREPLHQLIGRCAKVARRSLRFHADLQSVREHALTPVVAVTAFRRKRHRVVALQLAPVRRHRDAEEISAVEGLIPARRRLDLADLTRRITGVAARALVAGPPCFIACSVVGAVAIRCSRDFTCVNSAVLRTGFVTRSCVASLVIAS